MQCATRGHIKVTSHELQLSATRRPPRGYSHATVGGVHATTVCQASTTATTTAPTVWLPLSVREFATVRVHDRPPSASWRPSATRLRLSTDGPPRVRHAAISHGHSRRNRRVRHAAISHSHSRRNPPHRHAATAGYACTAATDDPSAPSCSACCVCVFQVEHGPAILSGTKQSKSSSNCSPTMESCTIGQLPCRTTRE